LLKNSILRCSQFRRCGVVALRCIVVEPVLNARIDERLVVHLGAL
jgi:hypothetical protein